MRQNVTQFFNKLKMKLGAVFYKLKNGYVIVCKWFNDMIHNQNGNVGLLLSIACIIFICVVEPILNIFQYSSGIWLRICEEIIYALFTLLFISSTVIYNKKHICYWIASFLFLVRYLTLIDIGARWNKQFGIYYLGLAFIFFCSWGSYISAKDINKKGGIFDTIILTVGLALFVMGFISMQWDYVYNKYLIIFGIALIYLYAMARSILQIFFSHNNIKIDLFKTMIYVVVYIALIIGLPFFLKYAGVKEQVLNGIIIPIYAAAIGGILTLAGVAWTIKHGERLRIEEERKKFQPLFTCKYFDWNDSKYKSKQINQIQFNNDAEEVSVSSGYINIKNVGLENTSKVEFFLCGIFVNGKLIKTNTKELIGKEQIIRFENMQVSINSDQVEELKLYVSDIIDNFYTVKLEFTVQNHIVIIKGNNSLQLVGQI